MMKKLALVVAAALLALPGRGLAQVKVGFINSITGPEAPIGETLTNGVELAMEDLAKKGIKIQLVKQDDTGKPPVAMSAMEQLATGDEVAAVVGPYTSANANAVAKLAAQYKVAQVIPAASKEDITRQGNKYVFRVNAPSHSYAESLIDLALSQGKPKTIAFIYESTDFGTSAAAAGKEYSAKKGLQVVGDEAYQKGAPDYRSTLTKVKAANPDLVFMVSYVADAILLMRQAREVGLKPMAFLGGGAGFDTTQFESEKDISNLVFSTTQWTPDMGTPGAADFAKRYQAKYGKPATYHAACAYASMMIVGETVGKVGGDKEKVRDALASGSWTGIMGEVKFETFDGFTNQNKHDMAVVQYQAGVKETVFPPKFAKKKPVWPFTWGK
ncbi:MAG: ABC transporter substrate-binding protein [Anaeromyxobacteraceae bacterium]